MTKERLEELGWSFDDCWNNRNFYKLDKEFTFEIFEQNEEYGVLNPFSKEFELIYCNLTDGEIIGYTILIKIYKNIINHPKDNSLDSYNKALNDLIEFIDNIKNRK